MPLGVMEVLDLVGIFVFAVSGALLAVRRGFALIGMLVFAESGASVGNPAPSVITSNRTGLPLALNWLGW